MIPSPVSDLFQWTLQSFFETGHWCFSRVSVQGVWDVSPLQLAQEHRTLRPSAPGSNQFGAHRVRAVEHIAKVHPGVVCLHRFPAAQDARQTAGSTPGTAQYAYVAGGALGVTWRVRMWRQTMAAGMLNFLIFEGSNPLQLEDLHPQA